MEIIHKVFILIVIVFLCCWLYTLRNELDKRTKEQAVSIEQSIRDNYKRIETNLQGIGKQIGIITNTVNELQGIAINLQEQTVDLESGIDKIQVIYKQFESGLQSASEGLNRLEELNRLIREEIEKL